MKDRTNSNEKCFKIQKRIFAQHEAGKDIGKIPEIVIHLKTCEDCKEYVKVLRSLVSYDGAEVPADIEPNPRIKKNIVNYFELQKQLSVLTLEKKGMADWLREVFTIRIPVYQVLGGLALMLIIFGFITGLKSSPMGWWMKIDYSATKEGYENTNLYVLDTLHLLDSTRGENALEDSILVGFLEASL